MDATALVVGLAGGGTIGAVLTALLGHSHERDERHRERTLKAATDFLAALDRAVAAVVDVQGRARVARSAATASKARTGRFLEMSKDLVAAARDLPERDRRTGDDPDDGPLGGAIRALYEVYEVTKAQQVAAEDLVAVGDAVSHIEETLPSEGD